MKTRIDETKAFQSILGLTFKHRPLVFSQYEFDELSFHNEFKGETRNEEIEKWREKIKIVYGILSRFDYEHGFWIFQHKDHADYMEILNKKP